jgi:hypothetical protein
MESLWVKKGPKLNGQYPSMEERKICALETEE